MTNDLLSTLTVATISSIAIGFLIVMSQGWHGKHTLDHDLDGVQKFHTTAVPRIGGLAIAIAILVALVFSAYFRSGATARETLLSSVLLLVAGMPAFFAGIVEDLTKKVSVRTRLCAAIASSLLASWFLGATVDELNIWGFDSLLAWTPFALLVTAVTVSGGVNAINIIDGFNGLASSAVVVMLAALAAVGWHVGDMFVAELALIGVGAALGFLIVNYPTGRLFLGDGGAYLLGFWVAEIVVLLLVRNPTISAWQLLSICAYPIIEVLYSIYRRKVVRQSSPGAPDGLHLHTLVYRRLVSRYFACDPKRPWIRNAAVACIIVPWIAVVACISVAIGSTTSISMMIVAAQVVFYIAVYARLVRGNWRLRPVGVRLQSDLQEDDSLQTSPNSQ